MMSLFSGVQPAPADAIFLVKQNYERDSSPLKIDVGIGAYRDAQGKPYVLNVVKKAEALLINDPKENKEYLGIAGQKSFIKATREFAFGEHADGVKKESIATVQTLSGTGGLRVGLEFIAQTFPNVDVLIPNPTWGNHKDICYRTRLPFKLYRYWRQATRDLDFTGMIEDLENAKDGSVLMLHMCSHNPTGVDPTEEQWQQILNLARRKRFIPFLDAAYQGFASGNIEKDAYALRLFESEGLELFVAQSYSKNMGLYGERIGALSVACKSKKIAEAVESHLKKIIRAMYSNPPRHGAGIVSKILTDPTLFEEWRVELKGMTDRIKAMRSGLKKALENNGAPGDWSFITTQIGMFTYTGLSKEQVLKLQDEYHIYMPVNGRISVAGLTEDKLEYMANAIKSVL